MEDQDHSSTEIVLQRGGNVKFLETDGPLYAGTFGTWELNGVNFRMLLKRTYQAGHPKALPTDMGPFDYTTERTFEGKVTRVGEKVGMEGSILVEGERVGFFEMVDSREE